MKLQTLQFLKNKWSEVPNKSLDSANTLILIFAAPEFSGNSNPIDELVKMFPKSKIIGCSTAGEIAGARVFDNSLSVAITQFEKTPLKIVKADIHKADDSFTAGESISDALNSVQDLRGIFVLSDGIQVNGSELVKGLNKGVGNEKIVITGGLAGDGDKFKKTWSIFNGKLIKNAIVAVGLYGDAIRIGHASKGGWDIFGVERTITRSKNNILFELDYKPALQLYKEYLGDKAKGLPATGLLFPLAIRKNELDPTHLVRTILAINEQDQSLTFAGDVPEGYLAQLMKANFNRLIENAGEAGTIAINLVFGGKISKNQPLLSIAISCVGRRLLMGERIEEETESVLEKLPPLSKQVGFYSYGELSPYATGNCDLHNQTMTLTTLYEYV